MDTAVNGKESKMDFSKLDLLLSNEDSPDTAELENKIKEIAKKLADYRDCLFLGRNYNYPIALEGALKLKELSYIHAEGYPAAEMKHGPIALIDEHMPVVVIAPKQGHNFLLDIFQRMLI